MNQSVLSAKTVRFSTTGGKFPRFDWPKAIVFGWIGLHVVGVALAGFAPVKYMALGDSLTVGVTKPTLFMDGGYRGELAYDLGSGWQSVGPVADDVSNYAGFSGFASYQLRPSIAGWDATYTPDVTVLMAGTNDLRLGSTPDQASTSVVNLALACTGKVYVMPIPPNNQTYWPALTETTREQFNTLLYQKLQGTSVKWIETRDMLTISDLCSDGMHLRNPAYDRVGDRIYSVLKQG